jgi:hypothetical protein
MHRFAVGLGPTYCLSDSLCAQIPTHASVLVKVHDRLYPPLRSAPAQPPPFLPNEISLRFYDRQNKMWVSIEKQTGSEDSASRSVADATASLVRELTGGSVYYLPARRTVDIAR